MTLLSTLRRLLAAPSPRRRLAPRRRSCPLRLEALEQRTVPTAVAAPSGLVSWWTANNTAADAMGLNNATLSNVTYATGEVGKAFSFNGTNGWAALGDPSSLAFTQSFSIEGWIKVNGLPTNYNFGSIMFRGDDRGGLDPYQLVIQPNGYLQFGDRQCEQPRGQYRGPHRDRAVGPRGRHAGRRDRGDDALRERGSRRADHDHRSAVRRPGPDSGARRRHRQLKRPGQLQRPLQRPDRRTFRVQPALTPGEVLGIDKAGSSGKVFSPIAVDGPSVVDGSGGATTPVTFTLTRTGSLSGSLTVNWTTADDTAIAGTDYVAASGSVTFAAGQATQTVQVTTLNSNVPKPNVDFKLIATPAGGTSIMGLATILNDDASISVGNGSAVEGSSTLKFLDRFIPQGSGGLSRSSGSIFGPDGNLYVASDGTNSILRYDGVTGAFKDVFVTSGSGGLQSPNGLTFGPDGNLYVGSWGTGQVLRYDGSSGAFLGTVVSGLSLPIGLTFGPDGSLYIGNRGSNEVLRYNNSGLSAFVTAGSGGLSQPRNVVFGPDGNMYVASQGTGQVLRYNGQTGAFIDVFATMPPIEAGTGPMWLEFGTDGYLYTTARDSSTSLNMSIVRFNATNGTFVDSLPLGRDGWSFDLGPGNVIYDSADGSGGFVDRIGPSSMAAFTVSLASASAGTTRSTTPPPTPRRWPAATTSPNREPSPSLPARPARPSSFRPSTTASPGRPKVSPSTCRTRPAG